MNPIIKKSTDWIKSHKKTAISLACVTIAVIISIPIIAITSNKDNQVNNNNLSNSSYDSSSSLSDSSSDESSSSLNEGDIDTNNSDNSSATETTSSSNLTSTGGNSTSSTPSKQPTPPTSNGGNSSTKPAPPTPTPTPPKPTPPPPLTPPPVAQRTWEYMPALSRQTFDLMNKFRQDNGVAPLKWNETCNRRAKKIAEGNAKEQVIYHEEGQIALNNSTGTAESFIKQWSDSDKGHKQSMLQILYTGGAVAVYKDSNGRFYVVTDFWNDLFE